MVLATHARHNHKRQVMGYRPTSGHAQHDPHWRERKQATMIATIAVPLDGTPISLAALPLARAEAQAHGARLVLLRVVPAAEAPADPLLKEAQAELALTALSLAGNGVLVEVVCVRVGQPADVAAAILREARASQADLLIMAEAAAPTTEALAGDAVAAAVLAQSELPVLLVRVRDWADAAWRPGASVLVEVDGTPAARAALVTAATIARITHGEVTVLRVLVPARASGLAGYEEYADLADARTYVETQVNALRATGITIRGLAQFGDGPATVAAVARRLNAGMVVMSMPTHEGPICTACQRDAETIAQALACPVVFAWQPPARPGIFADAASGPAGTFARRHA
jgi:nucleotide-binding universal stress UspA family protein